MNDQPPRLHCPTCAKDLEYETSLEWRTFPTATIDVGYCATCQRRVGRERASGKWVAAAFRPRCPTCGDAVAFRELDREAKGIVYACNFPQHAYVWLHVPRSDRWIRR